MSKTIVVMFLAAGAAVAQIPADPEPATKKTAEQKGYHITKPKNTGATPDSAKQKNKTDTDDSKKKRDGLNTQTPPTRQPTVNPPGKP